jgi:LacI family transcriptional regulator
MVILFETDFDRTFSRFRPNHLNQSSKHIPFAESMDIRTLARLAGVSPSTVSKALNNRSDVNAETRRKVLEIATAHGYSPNSFAKGLKTRSTENIGLLFSRDRQSLSDNPFYSKVLEGVESELAINNNNMILSIIQPSHRGLPKMIRERHVDGVILIGIFHEDFLESLRSEGLPVVLVDPQKPTDAYAQVQIDNEYGGCLATEFLIRNGHRRIGFVSGDLGRLSFRQRYEGYRKALRVNGLEADDRLARIGGLEDGYAHFKALLQGPAPTGVFVANDINAIRGYKAVHDEGKRIPEDVSVVGFDDIDLASMASPPLTTVRVSKREFGSIAARTILRIVHGEEARPVIVMPVQIVERGSVSRRDAAAG